MPRHLGYLHEPGPESWSERDRPHPCRLHAHQRHRPALQYQLVRSVHTCTVVLGRGQGSGVGRGLSEEEGCVGRVMIGRWVGIALVQGWFLGREKLITV